MSRLDGIDGWLARQPEVDANAESIASYNRQIVELTNQLNEYAALVTNLQDQIQLVRAANEDLDEALAAAGNELARVRKELADVVRAYEEYRRTHPDPAPEPEPEPATRTLYGACPMKPGGTSLAAQTQVITKWGNGAAVRQFFGGISTVAPRNPDASIVHASWKEYNRANLTADKVRNAVKNLKPGDVVEDGHESDNDGLSAAGYAERVAIKNLFYDLVKQVRPDLHVSLTLVGYSFDPKSGRVDDLERWVKDVKFDVLGIDCDGVRPTKLPYTNFEAETKTVLDFMAKYPKIKYFAVPEYGCPRIPAADPDGKVRAQYHDFYAKLWNDTGKCLFVALYEYDSSPNYALTTPAEIAGWKKWVAR